jgi:phage terminase small subunit
MRKGLTPKQAKFVAEYLRTSNATDAARRAGYSKKNADVVGPRLLGQVGIREAIAKATGKLERTAEDYSRRMDEIAFKEPDENWPAATVTRALELGAKVRGMLRDRLEHTGEDGKPISITINGIARE